MKKLLVFCLIFTSFLFSAPAISLANHDGSGACKPANCGAGGSFGCADAQCQARRTFGGGCVCDPITGPAAPGAGVTLPPNLSQNCRGDQLDTAVGCIPFTEPNATIAWFLGWFLGISGGIAFLLIVYGGIQMMSASGDPAKLQSGREVLTAAVSGLVFIIFSTFLLRLIGVSVLNLPGF